MKPARFDGIVTRARLPETRRVHVRIHKSLAIGRLRRAIVAILVAMAVVAATAASVGAQWPTACVDLNDIVERHLGNNHNVGIYQRTFGDLAEDGCQRDHLDDVRAVFAWAFGATATSEFNADGVISDIGGWPTTCVELNDIVENHLGNDHNVAIYQRTFDEGEEPACQLDHASDVRQTFAWARLSDVAGPGSTSQPTVYSSTNTLGPSVEDLARTSLTLQDYLSELPWLGNYVYPWLADGISQDEVDLLTSLRLTAEVNVDLAIFIASTGWFSNGIDYSDDFRNEEFAPELIRRLYQTSPEFLNSMLTYSWLKDDITARELSTLSDINKLAVLDLDLAVRFSRAPWIKDEIEVFETYALDQLPLLYERFPNLARQLANYTLEAPVWASDIRLISTMYGMISGGSDEIGQIYTARFNRITSQPWFIDGLDVEERAFINALDMIYFNADNLFDRLLIRHYTQSATASLPLAGPIRLWAFQDEPFAAGENVLRRVAEGLVGYERIMQAALPANDFVILLGGPYSGAEFGGRLRLPKHTDGRPATDLIFKTVGESYFTFKIGPRYPKDRYGQLSPAWMKDGGLEFAKAYVNDWLAIRGLSDEHHRWSSVAQSECASKGLGNIHSVAIRPYPSQNSEARALERCASLYGSMLLFRLYITIGEEAVSSTLRDLYIPTVHDEARRNDEGILMPSDRDIFRTFLKHAAPHQHEQVRHWYRQLHGGPFIDAVN